MIHHVKFINILFLLVGLFISCEEKEKPEVAEVRQTPGDIQILNSCGIPGAAAKMRDYLRSQGFDVVELNDDRLWNYEETIIALRNPHWAGAEALAKALHTTNVIPLKNKRKMVDATVYIGKDFEQLIRQDTNDN
ncbi:MAG: LytR C-terminal domain-containing protein [Fibrobacteraceae bacterium]|nr:LytR C-terminal domain-containing protein [Fibrobacteraceae bacterium]